MMSCTELNDGTVPMDQSDCFNAESSSNHQNSVASVEGPSDGPESPEEEATYDAADAYHAEESVHKQPVITSSTRPIIQKSNIMCILCQGQDNNQEDEKSLKCSGCARSYHYNCLEGLGFNAKRIPRVDEWKCWFCDASKTPKAPKELIKRLRERHGLPKLLHQSTRQIKKQKVRKSRHQSAIGSVPEAVEIPESNEALVGSEFPDESEDSSSPSRASTPLREATTKECEHYEPRERMIDEESAKEQIGRLQNKISDIIKTLKKELVYSERLPLETLTTELYNPRLPFPPFPMAASFDRVLKSYLRLDEVLWESDLTPFRSLEQIMVIEGLIGFLIWDRVYQQVKAQDLQQRELERSKVYDPAGREAYLYDCRSRALALLDFGDPEIVQSIEVTSNKTSYYIMKVLRPLVRQSNRLNSIRKEIERVVYETTLLTIRLKSLPGSVQFIWSSPGEEFNSAHHLSQTGSNKRQIEDLREEGRLPLEPGPVKVLTTLSPAVVYKGPGAESKTWARGIVTLPMVSE